MSDKWEFANDNFKRGHKELLCEIHRRKNALVPPPSTGDKSGAYSRDELGSSSTSSQDSRNPGSLHSPATMIQFADLTDENQKLKKEKELLIFELAQTKKQCDDLASFLTEFLKVDRNQVLRNMQHSSSKATCGAVVKQGVEGERRLKLFGEWLEVGKLGNEMKIKKKRPRDIEQVGFSGTGSAEIMEASGFHHHHPLSL